MPPPSKSAATAMPGKACLEQASVHYAKSLQLDPGSVDVANNLGACLAGAGRRADAMVVLCRAAELNPGSVAAWANLGAGAKDLGDLETALLCFDRALALEPTHANTRWNRSLCLLALGRLAEGWADYDWRWRSSLAGSERVFPQPRWDGSNLQGKAILVWMEQGLGDQIFFASLLADLLRAGVRCVVECDPRLVKLLQRSFLGAEVMAIAAPPHPRTEQSDIQFQTPAGSLPRFLRPSLSSFQPGGSYLVPDPVQSRCWKERLDSLGEGLKVGICWRSGLGRGMRAMHYAEMSQWGPILTTPGVKFINLQYDQCDEELCEAERLFGTRVVRWEDLDLRNDQDGVAALISTLDLVISARTAVGAMAGAVGTSTIVLTRSVTDWWGLGTDYCPWQPSVRAFSCGAYDPWEPAIARIAAELGQLPAQLRCRRTRPWLECEFAVGPVPNNRQLTMQTSLSACELGPLREPPNLPFLSGPAYIAARLAPAVVLQCAG